MKDFFYKKLDAYQIAKEFTLYVYSLLKKYPSFDDYTFFGLKLKPNRELYNTIYRNGDRILLVSPKDIRSKMVKELESSLSLLKSVKSE